MKKLIVLTAALLLSIWPSRASDAPTTAGKPDAKADSQEEPDKPDIKEIFAKETSFTNAAGLVIQKISANLWVSQTEVTQEAYKNVTGGNPSKFAGDQHPVESISWNGAIAFCRSLTRYEAKEEMLPKGYAYWLPTEKQWESFAASSSLDNAVTSQKSPRQSTADVASLAPNAANLYDVRGNVMEWTANENTTYNYRVARGASWATSFPVNLRVAFRTYKAPNDVSDEIGFRVVLIPEGEAKTK